jgi:Fur family transcriptional regulator, stress-responsive regulator
MTTWDHDTAEAVLRDAGLRSTSPRRTVLEVVTDHPHVSAAELTELLGTAGHRLSRQSLSNVLEDLTRTGLLRTLQPVGSAPRYENALGGEHHHLVCRGCGAVVDVPCAVGSRPCLTPAPTPDFPVVEAAEVTWWGLCSRCEPGTDRTTTPTPPEPQP